MVCRSSNTADSQSVVCSGYGYIALVHEILVVPVCYTCATTDVGNNGREVAIYGYITLVQRSVELVVGTTYHTTNLYKRCICTAPSCIDLEVVLCGTVVRSGRCEVTSEATDCNLSLRCIVVEYGSLNGLVNLTLEGYLCALVSCRVANCCVRVGNQTCNTES